jgi:hypothetical protein
MHLSNIVQYGLKGDGIPNGILSKPEKEKALENQGLIS